MSTSGQLLHDCLYFTANALSRAITRMAEEEFQVTGLSPSYAFVVMLTNDEPGISQKAVAEAMQLAPSTVTRFVDSLIRKDLVRRESEGKNVHLFPTQKGKELLPVIFKAWKNLYARYSDILGKDTGDDLTRRIDRAMTALER